MIYSVSCSVSCSVDNHPIVHDVVDNIEDASNAAYNFVKSTFKSNMLVSTSKSEAHLAQIREEIDSVNHQLHIANLHVETLRQALDLSRDAQVSLQERHFELLDLADDVVEQSGYAIHLPQEVISHIGSILYWDAEEEWGVQDPGPHYEWVKTVYRPASEPVHFQTDTENQIRLANGSLAALTDGEHPLTIRYDSDSFSRRFPQSEDVSENNRQHILYSTSHRWRGLYLGLGAPCDVLNRHLAGLPTLTNLHLYGDNSTTYDSTTPLPTWWVGFVERFGRVGRTSPVLRSVSVPLRFLTTSGSLFSNVRYLIVQVDVPINDSSSELNSTLRDMHHLTTLKILLLDLPTGAKVDQKVIKLPYLEEFVVGGIRTGLQTLNETVSAFECKSLRVFCAELFELVSRPRPEEIASLINLVHDLFPTVKELFVQIPPTKSNSCCNDWDTGADLDGISHTVIRNLSLPTTDGYWLLPNLTTLAIPFVPDKSILRALVNLVQNRRTKEVSARIMYLKFVPRGWTTGTGRTQESDDILQSLLMNFQDVEVLKWSNHGEMYFFR